MSAELADAPDVSLVFSKYQHIVSNTDPIKFTGVVERVTGLLIESKGPQAVIGELCQILLPDREQGVWAEVVGLSKSLVQLMPFDDMEGIEVGCTVVATGGPLMIPVSDGLLGRVLDSMGRPIDDRGIAPADDYRKANAVPPNVLKRRQITERIVTGVRAIDAMTPVGKGQRLGIFSGSGVGKSTLLGMIARNTSADVNVIALIGERGREVREFIENDLGPEGLARSVIIVSTSDTPPLARLKGAYVATTIAEYFRDQGKDVMFLFDSVTRFARAQREIGLSVGEPPATRGYTPSVFSILPKLLERCGTSEKGTITGFYTILVDGDDVDEPISDNVRGILDGHLILSRRIASANQYPAVDVLQSLSRLAPRVTGKEERRACGIVRKLLATYTESEDLINVGAYVKGTNPGIDEAIDKIDSIRGFLAQGIDESAEIADTIGRLAAISGVELEIGKALNEAVSVST
ncbi:MAG TPA: FliI/YscN family ATPase [Spirochaetia bacterium]|nr:FliI/YscN family ATPase [Spirochaetia bacterium]